MSLIFKNINLLHADDCPMKNLNNSLEQNSLKINFNEIKNTSCLKFASVGIVQDKDVKIF